MSDESSVLKQLCARALIEFEDVQQKCKEYYEKLAQSERKRKHVDSQFKQLKQVSLLAVSEYESLHKQFMDESSARNEVESKLAKCIDENKELRKLNRFASNTTIISPNSVSTGPQETKGELEVLRSMKDAINAELRGAKEELARARAELEQERSEHAKTKDRLRMGAKQMSQLNRVSVLALDEFAELKRKFDIESGCRRKAEDYATEIAQKETMLQTKMSLIKDEVERDDRLKNVMSQIDELNALLQKERKESQLKIKDLEDELLTSKDMQSLKSVEEKLSLALEQLDLAQTQLIDADNRAEKAEQEVRGLYTRLSLAERALDSQAGLRLPPPPAPPPPTIAAPVIRSIISKIGGKKKKVGEETAEQPEDDSRMKAMEDMIARIKKGVKLKPVEAPLKGEGEDSAMGNLADMLSNMRRGQFQSQESLNDSVDEQEPAFAQVKLKKAAPTPARLNDERALSSTDATNQVKLKKPVPVPLQASGGGVVEESVELRAKLNRRKSLADQIDSTENDQFVTSPRLVKVDVQKSFPPTLLPWSSEVPPGANHEPPCYAAPCPLVTPLDDAGSGVVYPHYDAPTSSATPCAPDCTEAEGNGDAPAWIDSLLFTR